MNERILVKTKKTLDKKSFLNNLGLLFSAREKVLDSFKSRFFPIKNVDEIPTRTSNKAISSNRTNKSNKSKN